MRAELVFAFAIGLLGLMLMVTSTPICSNNCFIDNFFELFLPSKWERKVGGLPLIIIAIGLALVSARKRN